MDYIKKTVKLKKSWKFVFIFDQKKCVPYKLTN